MKANILLVLLLACGACSMTAPPVPRSSLELRAIQTREFDEPNSQQVMKAVLDSLQDEGFTVSNAVVELGLISATKDSDLGSESSDFWKNVLLGPEGVWNKRAQIEATANVSEFGRGVRVRITFQRKIFDNHGNVRSITPIDDGQRYQDFFAKVDHSIFIQRERI